MDMKSNVNFINSGTDEYKIICPNCSTLNEMDSLFCFSCGTKLEEARDTNVNLDKFVEGNTAYKSPADVQIRDEVQAEDMKSSFLFGVENMKRNMSIMANEDVLQQPQPESPKMTVYTVVQNPVEEPEEISVFAQGLPNWDMVPPQVVVRRKSK